MTTQEEKNSNQVNFTLIVDLIDKKVSLNGPEGESLSIKMYGYSKNPMPIGRKGGTVLSINLNSGDERNLRYTEAENEEFKIQIVQKRSYKNGWNRLTDSNVGTVKNGEKAVFDVVLDKRFTSNTEARRNGIQGNGEIQQSDVKGAIKKGVGREDF